MFCSNCGKKLEDKYKYCPKCGKKIEKDEDEVLYEEVLKYVKESGNTTISSVQKEFKISYAKASKLINKIKSNDVKEKEVVNDSKENIFKKDIFDTEDTTSEYDKDDIKNNTFLAILSYLGPLALIPYFVNTDSKFVKYHSIQGMNLLIIWLIYTILNNLLSLIKVREMLNFTTFKASRLVTPIWITFPLNLLGVGIGILSIIGIIYVCEGKAKELPIIGKLKIIK